MTLSELLQAVRETPQDVVVPSSWGQGRAGFGGLAAALVFEAMQAKVPSDCPVRSLSISFVGPLAVDVPVSFEAEVLREGKAVDPRSLPGGLPTVLQAPLEGCVLVAETCSGL